MLSLEQLQMWKHSRISHVQLLKLQHTYAAKDSATHTKQRCLWRDKKQNGHVMKDTVTKGVCSVQMRLQSATCSSHLPFLQEGSEGCHPSPRAH